MSKKRKLLILSLSILLILGILITGCAVYLSIYYKADTKAVEACLSGEFVSVKETDGYTSFTPEGQTNVGFIFYPGGKVEHKAYYPLMHTLAEYGIFSAVVKVPFRLAVFDVNAADDVKDDHPEIRNWFIGGHSLGGAMAATYLSKNETDFNGLVLLGAYSTKDLSKTDIAVLSIYGSEDGIMNSEKYEDCLSNLPLDFTELIIEGGCHSYFGSYGEQNGDGIPAITNEEQIYITASEIHTFIGSHLTVVK